MKKWKNKASKNNKSRDSLDSQQLSSSTKNNKLSRDSLDQPITGKANKSRDSLDQQPQASPLLATSTPSKSRQQLTAGGGLKSAKQHEGGKKNSADGKGMLVGILHSNIF